MKDVLYYAGNSIVFNSPATKTKLTLTVDKSLVEWAKRMKINLSASLEALLSQEYQRRNSD